MILASEDDGPQLGDFELAREVVEVIETVVVVHDWIIIWNGR